MIVNIIQNEHKVTLTPKNLSEVTELLDVVIPNVSEDTTIEIKFPKEENNG